MAEKDASRRVVVVTGLGTINSAGENVEAYWEAALSGDRKDAITNEREWLLENIPGAYRKKFRSHLMGRIKGDNLASKLIGLNEPAYEHIDDRYIERYISRSGVVGMIATAEAMRHANAYGAVNTKRFAFVLGTGIGGGVEISTFKSAMEKGENLPPTGMPKTQPENAMIQLAMAYGAKGPSKTITAACSSGNAAVIAAREQILNNRADMVVAGGVEGFDPMVLALFERTRAADTGEDPSTASRVFHPDAGGAIASEAGSVLVLEELESAKARGAKILAIVAGGAESNDAADPTMLSGEGIEDTMNLSLEEAGITEDDFISVNTHGTAAPRGDPVEIAAVGRVFSGQRRYHRDQIRDRLVGLKAVTGHALGGANGTEAIGAVMMLQDGEMPVSSWLHDGVIEGAEDLITDTRVIKKLPLTAVLSNGMGFGGQNTSVVFMSYEEFARRHL